MSSVSAFDKVFFGEIGKFVLRFLKGGSNDFKVLTYCSNICKFSWKFSYKPIILLVGLCFVTFLL